MFLELMTFNPESSTKPVCHIPVPKYDGHSQGPALFSQTSWMDKCLEFFLKI
jgi:hypothetical protein